MPSQGYVAYGTKEKLKPEFIGRDASEIKALKAKGVEITTVVSVPEVAFTGDTTIDWVDRARGFAPSVMDGARSEGNVLRDVDAVAADALRARLLICECTFVDDRCSAEDARRFGHTHVDDIVARADAFRDVGAILLIHFSARYKAEEVREALAARLGCGDALRRALRPRQTEDHTTDNSIGASFRLWRGVDDFASPGDAIGVDLPPVLPTRSLDQAVPPGLQ